MIRLQSLFVTTAALMMFQNFAASADEPGKPSGEELYEVRHYLLSDDADPKRLDDYFRTALVPALNRAGVERVGVFTMPETLNADVPERMRGRRRMTLICVLDGFDELRSIDDKLDADATYQAAAATYWNRPNTEPLFDRIETELLSAMDCQPQVRIDAETLNNDNRVYEFRLYESATERLAKKKVDMFNNGEVPIFLKTGVTPVFIGEAIVGPNRPSLSYLTVYDDDASRLAAWDRFRSDPDWKALSSDPQYANTVSKIIKLVMRPTDYSQL